MLQWIGFEHVQIILSKVRHLDILEGPVFFFLTDDFRASDKLLQQACCCVGVFCRHV